MVLNKAAVWLGPFVIRDKIKGKTAELGKEMETEKQSNNVFSKKMNEVQPKNGLSGCAGQAALILVQHERLRKRNPLFHQSLSSPSTFTPCFQKGSSDAVECSDLPESCQWSFSSWWFVGWWRQLCRLVSCQCSPGEK